MSDKKSYIGAPMSPSQLELANPAADVGCMRRWAFAYRAGISGGSNAAADAGTAVHTVQEKHQAGEPIDTTLVVNGYPIGALAFEMAKLGPAPGTAVVEGEFVYKYGGHEFTGRMDLRSPNWTKVSDWKTTSKSRGIKSKKTLETNIQKIVYTAHPNCVDPEFEHIYGVWSTLEAKRVSLRVLTSDAIKLMNEIVMPIADKVQAIGEVDPLSLPPTLSACRLFPPAGCEHSEACFPTNTSGAFSTGLLERLREEQGPMDTEQLAPAQQAQEPPKQTFKIGTLYAGCIPLGTEYALASRLIAVAAATVCNDLHIHHAMLAQYGTGPASIAAQLVHDIEAGDYIPALVLEVRTPEGRGCQQSLSAIAEKVVVGL